MKKRGKITAVVVLLTIITAAALVFIVPGWKEKISDFIVISSVAEEGFSEESREYEEPEEVYTDSETVFQVQKMLCAAGYTEVAADGDLGPITEGAIRDFQKNQGMDSTGEVTDSLLDRLREFTSAPKETAPALQGAELSDVSDQMMSWFLSLKKCVEENDLSGCAFNLDKAGNTSELYAQAAELARLQIASYDAICVEDYGDEKLIFSWMLDENGNRIDTQYAILRYENGRYLMDLDMDRVKAEINSHICGRCNGSGSVHMGGNICAICSGTGQVYNPSQWYDGMTNTWMGGFESCSGCGGAGYFGGSWVPCSSCGGWGLVH